MSEPKIIIGMPELPEGVEAIGIYTAWSPEADSLLYGPVPWESFSPLKLQTIVKREETEPERDKGE